MADDDLRLDPDDERIEAILRSMSAEDLELRTPPASVWTAIEREMHAVESDGGDGGARVIPIATRRRRPGLILAAAAAVVVIVAGLAVALTSGSDAEPVEIATSSLTHIDDPGFVDAGVGASATATLLEDGDRRLVRFDAAELPAPEPDTDLELWLIGLRDSADPTIRTLGLVEDIDNPGTYVVPDDFDLAAYEAVAVDISIEPRDGDESHSGRSIIRGTIEA